MTDFHREQRTIGTLIADLAACDPGKSVAFDFCGFAPNGMHACSPHGDLALGFARLHDAQRPTVEKMLDALRGALFQNFHPFFGEKPFKASHETRLWVGDNYPNTVITGLDELATVWLRTAHAEIYQ